MLQIILWFFFEHPIQLEPIEEKGIVKFVPCKNTRFTQYRVDVVKNLNKVKIDDQLQKMDNFLWCFNFICY